MHATISARNEEKARTLWRRFCREFNASTDTGSSESADIGLNLFDPAEGVFEVEINLDDDPGYGPRWFEGVVEGSGLATYEGTFKAEPIEAHPETLYVVQFRVK